jgi:hypothetical protein
MGLISEILSHGGFLPQLAELNTKKPRLNKKTGVTMGAFWLMFFLLIMAPLFGIANVEEMAAASAVIGIFGGLMLMIASVVFLPSSKTVQAALPFAQAPPQPHLHGNIEGHALPPSNEVPASGYAPPAGSWRARTEELTGPGSVTEGTTKLLEQDKN